MSQFAYIISINYKRTHYHQSTITIRLKLTLKYSYIHYTHTHVLSLCTSILLSLHLTGDHYPHQNSLHHGCA